MTIASSVQTDTTLIKTEFAAKCRESASSSTSKKASARSATKATPSEMVDAKESTTLTYQTSAASCGSMAPAKLAQKDGSSTLMESVFQSATSALLGMNSLESAPPATTAHLSKPEDVSLMTIQASSPKATCSAKFGTNPTVSNVQTEVTSMLMDSAFQSALSATLLIRLQETASLASKDTTSSKDNASTPLPTLPLHLI